MVNLLNFSVTLNQNTPQNVLKLQNTNCEKKPHYELFTHIMEIDL